MLDRHARDVAQLHRLPRDRIGAGDHRLRGDHRGHGRQHDHRDPAPLRHAEEERIACRAWVFEQQRTLAEVVQHQRRQDEEIPAVADGLGAEVAHVGVQRLATGHRQHHRAEDEDAAPAVLGEETDAVQGIQCVEHFRVMGDVEHADDGQHREPQQHHRAEHLADFFGAEALAEEQHHQHRDRQRHDPGVQPRRYDLQALDRRQRGDRRSDHAVAEEQRGAEDAEDADDVGGRRSPSAGSAGSAPSAP